jgi:hypothetical protein
MWGYILRNYSRDQLDFLDCNYVDHIPTAMAIMKSKARYVTHVSIG